jgi:hypothetical protein
MASAADSYLVQTSMMKEDETPDFTSKQWTFINDINQGNYGNRQVQFDMSGFFNAARFMSFSEMILVLPLVTTLSPLDFYTDANPSATGLNGLGPNLNPATSSYIPKPNNLYSVGFKSGYWNLIYSMSVNADGVDVVQLQPNLNYLCSAKAMMEWSQSDVDKHGPLCGFLPDDDLSWGINATQCGNENGFGVYNNSLPPEQKQIAYSGGPASTTTAPGTSSSGILNSSTPHVNRGLYERMLKTSSYIVPLSQGVGATAYDPKYTGKDQGSLSSAYTTSLADSVFPVASTSGAQNSAISDNAKETSARVWITTAYIRLKDVCDFFSKLPLCRSLNLKLIINLNTGHLTVRQPNFLSSYSGAPESGTYALHPLNAAAGTFYQALSGTSLAPVLSGTWAGSNIVVSSGSGTVDTAKLKSSASTHVNACAGQVTPDFGYGNITDNSFQNTCPLMLAKCVSSVLTNVSSVGGVQIGTPNYNQNVEQDLYPGLNCGIYSQYRNGLALSIAVAAPDTNYHNVTGLSSYTHPLKSCRIYVPSVEMVPSKAIRYLENHKQQMVVYDDFYTFTYNGIASGGQFNYMAANNIANAKYLIVIPFYHDDTVGSVASANNVLQTRGDMAPQHWNMNCSRVPFEPISPFDSAPATTAPGAMISRYNVLLSNQTVYQRDREYDFETFLEEVEELGAINGGLDTGLTSGLIDFRKWSNNYRYYVTNLARRLEGDNTPKSITLQGINSSAYPMDLQIFVIYSKKVSLDCGTGRVSV